MTRSYIVSLSLNVAQFWAMVVQNLDAPFFNGRVILTINEFLIKIVSSFDEVPVKWSILLIL